jgi:hypothetical protein
MGSAIVGLAMVFVFFMRDVHLLAAGPRNHLLARLGAYGVINGTCLVVLTNILTSRGAPDLIRLVHWSPLWMLAILWHGLLWRSA